MFLSRSEVLIGKENIANLSDKRIAIFGIGGVGSFVAESLVRCGVTKLVLVDDDFICLTNLNRQLHATRKTVGKHKTIAMSDRLKEINPDIDVICIDKFVDPENIDEMFDLKLDYVVDCVDTVTAKLAIIQTAQKNNVPIISCMGTGNKIHPEMLELTDIYKTTVCPLAKVMRKELRTRCVKKLTVCYSKEIPIKPKYDDTNSCANKCVCPKETKRFCTIRREIPGSVSFMPSTAGLIISGKVVRDLCGLGE